jgi:AcrR family transcriptional regulator
MALIQVVLEAATAEFAAHGLAGARVDRIAAAAPANKAQIYHYFGSKDDLFDALFRGLVVDTISAVPMDVHDLQEYAGRLYDSYERRPELRRIATWRRLERGAPHPALAELVENNRNALDAIAQAHLDRDVSDHFAPVELLTIVLTLAAMWMSQTPELMGVLDGVSSARRRQVVVDAVRAVVNTEHVTVPARRPRQRPRRG